MSELFRRARDPELLDELDAFAREAFELEVWRVVRAGRDPTLGGPSRSRWCNGSFDILYTCLEQQGAVAEIHALLSLQPVFPSRDHWSLYRLNVRVTRTLRIADLAVLARLGIDTVRYADRDYGRTQAVADAAYFLGFDGLIAPSARWSCLNVILFTDRVPPDRIQVVETAETPVDWQRWRRELRR